MLPNIYLSPSSQTENRYAYGNTTEAIQCHRIADAAEVALKRCGFPVKNGQTGSMYDRVAESNAWGAALHVVIHTNAYNGNVTGTRIFCFNDTGEGYKASCAVFNVLAPVTLGTSENVTENASLYEVYAANAPTVYIEVDFHDVVETAKWIIENVELIGECIAKGICNHYGVKYVEPIEQDVLYSVQIGVYRERENAEAALAKAKAAGFTDAFIVERNTDTVDPVKKSVDEIAKEVIQGKWGSGTDRKNRLTAAGYDYPTVQNRVNEILK